MTLGERLQQLRKEKQMSQEELGNLLLVSRQTVSLWENNQTVPTVDNLIRLKEIFGISVDSILTGEEPVVPVAAPDIQPAVAEVPPADYYYTAPVEKYFFSLYKKDLKRYNLKEGTVLADKQKDIFLLEILPYRAKARCLKLLQARDYTEAEIGRKLKEDLII